MFLFDLVINLWVSIAAVITVYVNKINKADCQIEI